MPTALLSYFSVFNSTRSIAERIATGLRAQGYTTELCNVKDATPPDPRGYDLLGVGFPVYYFRPPFVISDYVGGLPDLAGLPTFVFMLRGSYAFNATNQVRRALGRKGAREVGLFESYGIGYFVGYLKQGYLFSPAHPTAEELAAAEDFGATVAARVSGQPFTSPPYAPGRPLVYQIEELVTRRFLVQQVYSRMIGLDANACDGCGLCVRSCPMHNIELGVDKRPQWGRDCLLCGTCELKCPRDAISTPLDWAIMRPFMKYNVRHASADQGLAYDRVELERGRIQRRGNV